MWLLVLCHVTWCNAMSCDVRSCEELSSVVPCNGMECYKVKLPLFSKQLLCTTKYYSSTRPYYKVLLRTTKSTPVLLRTTKYYSSNTTYYSVLQSTTPVLLCTIKYYSSTTLYFKVLLQYYNVLLQYYSVLPSTTPVLLCTTPVLLRTTKYYSSTTPYYKVLLQYYSVLQSTTPVLLCTTPVLLCTTKYYSGTTLKRHFTMRVAKRVTLQLHQILHLPRKMNLMIDPRHIWNVIYNARSNRHQPPTSPNTAPARQNESHD